MISDLSEPTEKILKTLKGMGAVVSRLDDTNAFCTNYKNKDYYFIGNMTPLVPMIYGIFASRSEYVEEILREGSFKFKERSEMANSYKGLITSNGYVSFINKYKDVTNSLHPSYKNLAKELLNLMPGAKYICFEINTSEPPTKNVNKNNCLITGLAFDLTTHINFNVHNDSDSRSCTDVIIELICGRVSVNK